VAELDLQMAVERERSARFQFNRFRSTESDEVPEQLEELEASLTQLKVEIPPAFPARLDLKAAEAASKQQQAAYDEASQNIFPDITAYASWRGNGLDPNFSPANEMAFQNNKPTYNLGAQFTLPLDVFTASRVSEGYKKNYESAVLAYQNKQIEVSQEWKDLSGHLADVDKRLAMAAQIEEIQKNKANQEKTRLELGRTTQFQLLSFENDYALARLSRLSLVLEKLSSLAQAQWWLTTEK
jgi:outer membrane protein TolC